MSLTGFFSSFFKKKDKDVTESENQQITKSELLLALNSIRCCVYEMDFVKNELLVIQNNTGMPLETGGRLIERMKFYTENYVHHDDRYKFNSFINGEDINHFFYNENERVDFEYCHIGDDKKQIWRNISLIKSSERPFTALVISNDISGRKLVEEKLSNSEERLNSVLNYLYDTVMEIDLEEDKFLLIKTNVPKYWENTDLSFSEMCDFICENTLLHSEYTEQFKRILSLDYIKNELEKESEAYLDYLSLFNGKYKWFSLIIARVHNSKKTAILMIKNIDKMKREQELLLQKANFDVLTQIYSKTMFFDTAREFISESGAAGQHMIIALDLDNFGRINHENGHPFGDMVMCNIINKIKRYLKNDDLFGRIGGDEFIMLLKNIEDTDEAQTRLKALMNIFERPFDANNSKFNITACIGAVLYPLHGKTFDEIYEKVDFSLSFSKRLGYGNYTFYDENIKAVDSVERKRSLSSFSSSIGSSIDVGSNKAFNENFSEYIFDIMYNAENIDDAIPEVLNYVGNRFNVSRAYVIELSENGEFLNNTFEWTAEGITSQIEFLQDVPVMELNYEGFDYRDYFKDGNVFICNDIDELNPVVREILNVQNIYSTVQCAMLNGGEMAGFIGFDECNYKRVWTENEIQSLIYISRILGVFYINKKVFDRLNEKNRMINSLLDNIPAMSYVINPNNYEILLTNKYTQEKFPHVQPGKICYKAFRDKDVICDFCPLEEWKETKEVVHKVFYVEELDMWNDCMASGFQWSDGQEMCLINAYDITGYKKKGALDLGKGK